MKTFRKVMAILSALAVMSLSATALAEVEVAGDFGPISEGAMVELDIDDLNAAGGNRIVAIVDATKAIVGQEMTFVVFNNDVTDLDIANGNITADDILYIDQKTLANTTEGKKFTGAINLSRVNDYESGDTLVDGDYPVRVGYYYDDPSEGRTFGMAVGKFTVSSTPAGTLVQFILGDVDGEDGVVLADANYIVAKIAGGSPSVGGPYAIGQVLTDINKKSFVFGDVDGEDGVVLADANYIVAKIAGGSPTVGATNGDGEAVGIGSIMSFTVPAAE